MKFWCCSCLLALLLAGCAHQPALYGLGVVIDSTTQTGVLEIDFRSPPGSYYSYLVLEMPAGNFSYGNYAYFYLGNVVHRGEYDNAPFYKDTFPPSGTVTAAGYRLYDAKDQLIAQDEIQVRLLY